MEMRFCPEEWGDLGKSSRVRGACTAIAPRAGLGGLCLSSCKILPPALQDGWDQPSVADSELGSQRVLVICRRFPCQWGCLAPAPICELEDLCPFLHWPHRLAGSFSSLDTLSRALPAAKDTRTCAASPLSQHNTKATGSSVGRPGFEL